MPNVTNPMGSWSYRLRWDAVTGNVRAYWDGTDGPWAEFSVAGETFGAGGLFSLDRETEAWVAKPLDVVLDPERAQAESGKGAIRDAVLAELESVAPFASLPVRRARKTGRRNTRLDRMVLKLREVLASQVRDEEIEDLGREEG